MKMQCDNIEKGNLLTWSLVFLFFVGLLVAMFAPISTNDLAALKYAGEQVDGVNVDLTIPELNFSVAAEGLEGAELEQFTTAYKEAQAAQCTSIAILAGSTVFALGSYKSYLFGAFTIYEDPAVGKQKCCWWRLFLPLFGVLFGVFCFVSGSHADYSWFVPLMQAVWWFSAIGSLSYLGSTFWGGSTWLSPDALSFTLNRGATRDQKLGYYLGNLCRAPGYLCRWISSGTEPAIRYENTVQANDAIRRRRLTTCAPLIKLLNATKSSLNTPIRGN